MSIRAHPLRIAALAGGTLAGLYAAAWYANRRFEDLEPDAAGAPGSFLEVDGLRMHYVEAGEGDAVVLIHGIGASTFSFRYTIPELAQQFRVVALDLLGFGFSARPADGDYSLTAQAAL
ncbi:MAG: alpha/beta fold hydrolase, partial [Dehalococcoidia bacterium]|nr:alpha/beta fold hydrolase [Dehalococcoidia bacterium]